MGYIVVNGKSHITGRFEDYNKESKGLCEKNIGNLNFNDILKQKVSSSKAQDKSTFNVSKHAGERIKDLNFSEEDMKKINEGINLADEKGCKESLLMYKDVALITSVQNRTIITAISKDRSDQNVFTNIDSVLFL
jgi:flagellar operon protein